MKRKEILKNGSEENQKWTKFKNLYIWIPIIKKINMQMALLIVSIVDRNNSIQKHIKKFPNGVYLTYTRLFEHWN